MKAFGFRVPKGFDDPVGGFPLQDTCLGGCLGTELSPVIAFVSMFCNSK